MIKYLILIITLTACSSSYSRYSVLEEPYTSDIDVIQNIVNSDTEVTHMDKHKLTTKWERVYVTQRWEHHYRFVVNFDNKTLTAQCMVRDQSRNVQGKERPWYFKPCTGRQIMKLVKFDLAAVSG
jgi:hypothetical protein